MSISSEIQYIACPKGHQIALTVDHPTMDDQPVCVHCLQKKYVELQKTSMQLQQTTSALATKLVALGKITGPFIGALNDVFAKPEQKIPASVENTSLEEQRIMVAKLEAKPEVPTVSKPTEVALKVLRKYYTPSQIFGAKGILTDLNVNAEDKTATLVVSPELIFRIYNVNTIEARVIIDTTLPNGAYAINHLVKFLDAKVAMFDNASVA